MPGSASTRVAVSAAFGAVIAVATGAFGEWIYAFSVGWDVAAVIFLGWTWLAITGMDSATTEAHATGYERMGACPVVADASGARAWHPGCSLPGAVSTSVQFPVIRHISGRLQ
jgi:hypothetical protein